MSGRHVESITRLEDLVLAVDGEGQFPLPVAWASVLSPARSTAELLVTETTKFDLGVDAASQASLVNDGPVTLVLDPE
jgi:hypothetical protein